MSTLTPQPTLLKRPSDVSPIAVSFKDDLTIGDLLTGTPTVTVSPSGPTLSAAAVNTITLPIELPNKSIAHYAKAGQAVTFTMSGGTVNIDYVVSVTVSTTGGRTFGAVPVNVQCRAT